MLELVTLRYIKKISSIVDWSFHIPRSKNFVFRPNLRWVFIVKQDICFLNLRAFNQYFISSKVWQSQIFQLLFCLIWQKGWEILAFVCYMLSIQVIRFWHSGTIRATFLPLCSFYSWFFLGLFSPAFTVNLTVVFAWSCLFVCFNTGFAPESLSGLEFCSTSRRGFRHSPIVWGHFTNVKRIRKFFVGFSTLKE